MTPAPCLLTAPTDDELEAADPGYLEDLAAATIANYCYGSSSGTSGTYYLPQVTTSSTTGTYTLTYGGGGGGVGGYVDNGWVYLGTFDTTVHFYEPPDELVAEPLTEEQATREWLWVELQSWLAAERIWQDAERPRRGCAAKAKAEALLLSLLPEPEKQRYRLDGYFEVIGSHGGHYPDQADLGRRIPVK